MTSPTGSDAVAQAGSLLAGAHYDQCGSRCWPENPPHCVDCSGLVSAVRRHLGLIGDQECDGSFGIMRQVYGDGLQLDVETAMHTPGAVLAIGINNGRGGIPGVDEGHIGFSVGDGVHSIEARGHEAGVGLFYARSLVWSGAGRLPGVDYLGTQQPPSTLPPYALEEDDEMIAMPNSAATLNGRTATARAVKNFNFALLEDGARVQGDVQIDSDRHWWAPTPAQLQTAKTIIGLTKSLDGKNLICRYANPDGSTATFGTPIIGA